MRSQKQAGSLKAGEYRHCRLQQSGKLLSVTSDKPGLYQVRGQGGGLLVGDQLELPMKGTQTLSLQLKINKIDYQIEPADSWSATLVGHNQEEWLVRSWNVACDQCGKASLLEFICPENADEQLQINHAQQRLLETGWQDKNGQHICPPCQAKGSHATDGQAEDSQTKNSQQT